MDVTIAYLIPVISGVIEVVKRVLPDRFVPLASVVLGGVAGYFFLEGELAEQILTGIVLGLSASGLYDVVKNPITRVLGGKKKRRK